MKCIGIYCNCNYLRNHCSYSQRFSTEVWAQSTLEEPVQKDVVPLAVSFLWPHNRFSRS